MTIAEQVASVFRNDGQVWKTDSNKSFDEVCKEHGADIEYAEAYYVEEEDEIYYRQSDYPTEHIRYTFSDGSALVVHGDGWDYEGDSPFSWRG